VNAIILLKPKRTNKANQQSDTTKVNLLEMFQFPYSYKTKFTIHNNIYGEYDIYYYCMRILHNYLSMIEKYQGIYKIDLDNQNDYSNLKLHIKDRIEYTKDELPNDTVVFKIIRSMEAKHFLRLIKSYCKNKNIQYTTNLNYIDTREFLAYSCEEIIGAYKNDIIEGWTDNKWERCHSDSCKIYVV
jgi:hypothetical protein